MLLSGVAFHLILAALVIRTFKRGRHSSEGPEAKARRHGFDFRFLKDWRFDVWLVYFMLGTFTTPLPYFALSDYARDNEFSETVGLWMLSSYSLVSIPARFAIGVFVHNFPRQTMVFATLTTGLFGVTLVLLGYIQTEVHGLLLASLGGLCSGFLIGSQSVATLQLSGVNKFALYFGITSTAAGVTKMISGPILGNLLKYQVDCRYRACPTLVPDTNNCMNYLLKRESCWCSNLVFNTSYFTNQYLIRS